MSVCFYSNWVVNSLRRSWKHIKKREHSLFSLRVAEMAPKNAMFIGQPHTKWHLWRQKNGQKLEANQGAVPVKKPLMRRADQPKSRQCQLHQTRNLFDETESTLLLLIKHIPKPTPNVHSFLQRKRKILYNGISRKIYSFHFLMMGSIWGGVAYQTIWRLFSFQAFLSNYLCWKNRVTNFG